MQTSIPVEILETIYNSALFEICETLEYYGLDLKTFGLVKPKKSDCFKLEHQEILNEKQYNKQECLQDYQNKYNLMNKDQKKVFNMIKNQLYGNNNKTKHKQFFIDAPGGTGKTFVCNALLSLVRSKNDIALACASSGIAATNFPGGRTVHSRFKVPIPIFEHSTSTLKKQEKQLLQEAKFD